MDFKIKAKELVSKMTLGEKMAQMKYDSPAIERLDIPAYNWWNECLHGVGRSGAATVFPQAIGMAASFNTHLINEVATIISDEARAKYNEYKKFGSTDIYQGLTYWSPNINIFRDPRWGRGQETYGEDPYLAGLMGTAFIKGLQGDGKYRKLDATIKHFAVHSGPEASRHGFDAKISQEDLYDTYLQAFKYCIENAHPSAVMGAYNCVNGEACCASETLLKKILYGEFGFDGYVVSDCGAIADINLHHHITKNEAESAALAVNNSCSLNCGSAYSFLKAAYAANLVSEEKIDECVTRLMEARLRLGMHATDCEYDKISYDIIECSKHIEKAREMSEESFVLLKNDGILPLNKEKINSIAVIGPNADEKEILLGNYNGTPTRHTTLLQGILNLFDKKVYYAKGSSFYKEGTPYDEKPMREAIIAAKKSDIIILTVGINPRMEGEETGDFNESMNGDKRSIDLPEVQIRLISEILKLNKPTIFVNVSGSCMNLSIADEKCNAVLQCFYPGAEGGNAFADIIFGKVSPSGKLPVTFYKNNDDLPAFEDYSMDNRTYRYFTGTPLYAFGHGLTYSNFFEGNEKIYKNKITYTVKNIGDTSSKYASCVFIKNSDKFAREKFRFIHCEKVKLLPSQEITIEFEISDEIKKLLESSYKIVFKVI